jgi:hypothetical protein
MDLFCNTDSSALENINIIYPKIDKLLGDLVSWQATTYHKCLHNHLN